MLHGCKWFNYLIREQDLLYTLKLSRRIRSQESKLVTENSKATEIKIRKLNRMPLDQGQDLKTMGRSVLRIEQAEIPRLKVNLHETIKRCHPGLYQWL